MVRRYEPARDRRERPGRGTGRAMEARPGLRAVAETEEDYSSPTSTSVEDAVAALSRGEFVVVTDDANRENEGDLVLGAQLATTQSLAFMVRHTSGLICAPMLASRLDELSLPLMVSENNDPHRTAFTVSVDARHGISTGISAADRAATVRALADQSTTAGDFTRPGHVFPLRYREGGVLRRPGHTEAAVDLLRLAGLAPVGVISEIVRQDGAMARGPELQSFAATHGFPLLSIAELIEYRRRTECLVELTGEAEMPTRHGEFRAFGFRSMLTGLEHVALVLGEPARQSALGALVRVHSECLTGDAFGSLRCDCGAQLDAAQAQIAAEGSGVLIYVRGHEGRGIGLGAKLRAYQLQDEGLDTVEANERLGYPADARRYGIAAHILRALGVTKLRLITNNRDKCVGLAEAGLHVEQRLPAATTPTPHNMRYLITKQRKLGHVLDLEPTHEVSS